MSCFLQSALEIKDEIIANRRLIHAYAEVGFDLPQTLEYVTCQLESYGYTPVKVGRAGVTCTVGKPGKTILLRADMDALPMAEESGLPYASTNGNAHTCGHDCHTAMLLGAAKLLKQNEEELTGTVKFMFQPAEEILSGASNMIEHGILKNPTVDKAFGLHISVANERSQSGKVYYKTGIMNRSGDAVRIRVRGMDAHGAKPYLGVDAISIAANIVIALNEVLAREIPSSENSVLLVGKISGGTSCNSVPGQAELEVSIRTDGHNEREFLLKRVSEISTSIAAAYRGSVIVEHSYGSEALVTDVSLSHQFAGYIADMLGDENVVELLNLPSAGGEDFAEVAARVPSAFFFLGCGSVEEGYTGLAHNPKMIVNEDVLPIGVATYVTIATSWLNSTE